MRNGMTGMVVVLLGLAGCGSTSGPSPDQRTDFGDSTAMTSVDDAGTLHAHAMWKAKVAATAKAHATDRKAGATGGKAGATSGVLPRDLTSERCSECNPATECEGAGSSCFTCVSIDECCDVSGTLSCIL